VCVCVVVYCSVLQCVAECCSVLGFVRGGLCCTCVTALHFNILQNTATQWPWPFVMKFVGSGSWGVCVPATNCNTPTVALAFCDGIREEWFVVCVCECNTLQ